MRVVEVRVVRIDFAEQLGRMREWLDSQKRPLARFETETAGDSITIKAQFDQGDLAEAFRQVFGGSYRE